MINHCILWQIKLNNKFYNLELDICLQILLALFNNDKTYSKFIIMIINNLRVTYTSMINEENIKFLDPAKSQKKLIYALKLTEIITVKNLLI